MSKFVLRNQSKKYILFNVKIVTMKTKNKNLMMALRDKFDDFWETDRWFPEDFLRSRFHFMPAVNIRDEKDFFFIEMAVPGMKKDDFKIEVNNGLLTISVEHSTSEEVKEDNYTRREFNYNAFNRSFTLPENVDLKKIDAHYENGLLTLNLKIRVLVENPSKRIAVT